jgi:hypothetical protein
MPGKALPQIWHTLCMYISGMKIQNNIKSIKNINKIGTSLKHISGLRKAMDILHVFEKCEIAQSVEIPVWDITILGCRRRGVL